MEIVGLLRARGGIEAEEETENINATTWAV